MTEQETKLLRCPTCGRRVARNSTRFAPFCSERCKLIDLGHWLDEDYRIPGEPVSDEFLSAAGEDDKTSEDR